WYKDSSPPPAAPAHPADDPPGSWRYGESRAVAACRATVASAAGNSPRRQTATPADRHDSARVWPSCPGLPDFIAVQGQPLQGDDGCRVVDATVAQGG